ncbi:hypothetical protein [Candidatus Nanohalococcus occultus]|uniref:Uncharacterized protein n=1 Tax=Candidatus Nanohalococcus occultus TaxID=2978047 RepID=A0ABY8CFM5_9ARCH|nr:hypothetical protein SVXNc_1000 [Candidatus Nanohaloarchaeota archaeon SVXNc]
MAEEVIFGGDEEDQTEQQDSQKSLLDEQKEETEEESEKVPEETEQEDEDKDSSEELLQTEETGENTEKDEVSEPEGNSDLEEQFQERLDEMENRFEGRIESLENQLEEEKASDGLDELEQRINVLESNSGLKAEFVEDLEARLDGLENAREELNEKIEELDSQDGDVSEEEIKNLKASIEDLPDSDIVKDIESELEEVKDRVAEKSDLISDVRENLIERIEEVEESGADTNELDKARVKADNLESRIESLEDSDAKDVSEFEDRIDELEASLSDIRWIFNDFEDLAELKLLTDEEFEDLKASDQEFDVDVESIEDRVNGLQERFDELEDAHYDLKDELGGVGSDEELGLIRERLNQVESNSGIEAEFIDTLEDRIEALEAEKQPDIEPILNEIERQEEEVRDIREGYQELGEMMRVILKELRETR